MTCKDMRNSLNKMQYRKILSQQLKYESKLVARESMEVLNEFEPCDYWNKPVIYQDRTGKGQ